MERQNVLLSLLFTDYFNMAKTKQTDGSRIIKRSILKKLVRTYSVKELHLHLAILMCQVRDLEVLPLPHLSGVIPWSKVLGCLPKRTLRSWRSKNLQFETELERLDVFMDFLREEMYRRN